MHQRRVAGRPRPVADPVVDSLAARPDEVARGWLLALVESRELADAAAIPVDVLTRDGPVFCAAVLAAVRSDESLDALLGTAGPADELGRLSGAAHPASVVAAAEALRRALRDLAAGELAVADTAVLADLGERAAHVCARLAALALGAAPAGGRRARPAAAPPLDAGEGIEPARSPRPLRPDPAGGGSPLWIGALDRQVAQGGRFALLLVELDGAERLVEAEGADAARDLFGQAARGVRGSLRRGDLLAQEDDGRIWLIAPEAGREGALALAGRVAHAIEDSASSREAPLTASIGVALYPEGGRTSDELTGRAEEAAFAARAAGVRVVAEADEPAAGGPRLVT